LKRILKVPEQKLREILHIFAGDNPDIVNTAHVVEHTLDCIKKESEGYHIQKLSGRTFKEMSWGKYKECPYCRGFGCDSCDSMGFVLNRDFRFWYADKVAALPLGGEWFGSLKHLAETLISRKVFTRNLISTIEFDYLGFNHQIENDAYSVRVNNGHHIGIVDKLPEFGTLIDKT